MTKLWETAHRQREDIYKLLVSSSYQSKTQDLLMFLSNVIR